MATSEKAQQAALAAEEQAEQKAKEARPLEPGPTKVRMEEVKKKAEKMKVAFGKVEGKIEHMTAGELAEFEGGVSKLQESLNKLDSPPPFS